MHTDFTSVDAELQEIEADFASGRMNAFGDLSTQEAFLREMRRIAEIETQVFYKSCTLLKSSSESEYAMLTSMFASAQPPPGSNTNNNNNNNNAKNTPNSSANFGGGGGGNSSMIGRSSVSYGGGGNTPGRPAPLIPPSQIQSQQLPSSSMSFGRANNNNSSRPSSPMSRSFQRNFANVGGGGGASSAYDNSSVFGDTANNMSLNFSMANSTNFNTNPNFNSGASFAANSMNKGSPGSGGDGKNNNNNNNANTNDWANKNGFDDHSFEEISEHYRRLEADFAAVGDNLRQISKHVVQLNTMSEQVNTAALDNGFEDEEPPQKTESDFLSAGSPMAR